MVTKLKDRADHCYQQYSVLFSEYFKDIQNILLTLLEKTLKQLSYFHVL